MDGSNELSLPADPKECFALLFEFQAKRPPLYQEFQKAFETLLLFPKISANSFAKQTQSLTQQFLTISKAIIVIADRMRAAGHADVADTIGELQMLEKEMLHSTVKMQQLERTHNEQKEDYEEYEDHIFQREHKQQKQDMGLLKKNIQDKVTELREMYLSL